jgi:hypothetical protein
MGNSNYGFKQSHNINKKFFLSASKKKKSRPSQETEWWKQQKYLKGSTNLVGLGIQKY